MELSEKTEWIVQAGDTILVPSGPKGNHLFVVLFDPYVPKEVGLPRKLHLASVNFTSVREGVVYDKACIVEANEHPFIEHESYINYAQLRAEDYLHVKKCIESGYFILHQPVTSQLLYRIRTGLLKSTFIRRQYKAEFRELI